MQPIRIEDLAARASIGTPVLSPTGHHLVGQSRDGETSALLVYNPDEPNVAPQTIPLGKTTLISMRWAGEKRLLLTVTLIGEIYGYKVPIFRLLAVDLPSGSVRILDRKSRGILGGDVLYASSAGDWALVASQDDLGTTPSVKRIDLVTGDSSTVEKARSDVWSWYADSKGVVRAGIAYNDRRWTIYYREKPDDKLTAVRGKFDKQEDSSVDRMFFGTGDSGTIVTNEKTGRFGVYKYDYKTATIGAAIYQNDAVDVSDLKVDNSSGEVSGVSYEDDRKRIVWFDPAMKAIQAKLDKALPGAINMIVDSSDDDLRSLVWSGGASDPGTYYLLDRKSWQMHPLFSPYERIDSKRLAPVKAVDYIARDGLKVPGYLTLPLGREAHNLPLILMPHGGPFLRDSWEYDPIVQFLASRGYAVLQPNFRGSTGYGKDYVKRGYGEWGRKMQDDLDDGVDWLVKSGQVDAKRVCIVGASYGGYAALWGAARNPDRYRCAISMSGVSNLPAQLRANRKSFSATRYFRDWQAKVGGEGKVDLSTVSPITFADRFKVPVLITHGEQDERVDAKQSHAMVAALTKANADVSSAFYKDAGHDFGSEADFADLLKRVEAFLAKNNPA